MKRMGISLTVLMIAFLGVHQTNAQNRNLVPRTLPITVGTDTETWKSEIGYLSQSLTQDEIVILVARLGNKETSSSLNRQRLRVARTYLHVSRGFEPPLREDNIVVAQGARVRGDGRMEAYVRGKLFMVFIFKRNQNFAPEP
jgi:hypothetical protein